MHRTQFTKIAKFEQEADADKKISEALDTLVRLLSVEAGSIKIYVQQGQWSPRLEVQMNVSREIKRK